MLKKFSFFLLVVPFAVACTSESASLVADGETAAEDEIPARHPLTPSAASCETLTQKALANATPELTKFLEEHDKALDTHYIIAKEDIDGCLGHKNNAPGFPDSLQGVWWMNGNPLPDDVLSFANAKFSAEQERMLIAVGGARNWTFHPSSFGNILANAVDGLKIVYDVDLSEDLAKIEPTFNGTEDFATVDEWKPFRWRVPYHQALAQFSWIIDEDYAQDLAQRVKTKTAEVETLQAELDGKWAIDVVGKRRAQQKLDEAKEELAELQETLKAELEAAPDKDAVTFSRESAMLGNVLSRYDLQRIVDANGNRLMKRFKQYLEAEATPDFHMVSK